MEEQSNLMPFEGKPIRKIWHNDEWYFSIVDVIEVLSESPKPTAYWNKVQKTLAKETQFYPIWIKLKLQGIDGKSYKTDCANTEGVFRIIMSVPSSKAEPLKMWMAQVSKERIEETENPELSYDRMAEVYKAKGRSDEWIKNRLQTITTRKQLTDEWKERKVKEGQEYGILTATIAKETFGLTPSEHSEVKGLGRQNLRDHMTPLELIFTALGEELARDASVRHDAQGFNENYDAAIEGGEMAGDARRRVEMRIF
jgi:DNA-damage-inducible protein D